MADGLRDRVAQGRRGQGNGGNGGAQVAAQDQGGKALIRAVREMQPQFALAMGPARGALAEQLVRDAVTLVRQQPKLAQCDQASVLGGIMTFAQLGLRLGTALGHGWLLPIRNRGKMQAVQVIGYKGYVKLAYNATALKDVRARTIREGDDWDVEYGTAERLVHRPGRDQRGAPVGYYCVVNLAGGGQVFQYMSQAEMDDHRDAYAMAREFDYSSGRPVPKTTPDGRPIIIGPWRDNPEPMSHKTVWLRCTPWVPMSADLELATAGDNTVRLDVNPTSTDAVVGEHPEVDGLDPDGAVPADIVEDPPAAPVERERVEVNRPGPEAEPAGRGSDNAAERPPTEPAAGPTPGTESHAPATPDPADLPPALRFAALLRNKAGVAGDDAAIVMAGILGGHKGKLPGSLANLPTAVLTRACAAITDAGDSAATMVLERMPADDASVWGVVAQAIAKENE